MKKTWNALLVLLLLTVPAALQAQFTYTTNADNTLTLSGYSGSGGVVIIPSSFDGLAVADIGSNVFSGLDITSVTMSNSITSIGDLAFSRCTSLTNVTMSDDVTNIGSGAFGFCTSLTSITIPASVTDIQDFAFIFCTNLLSITIPPGVTGLGQAVFQDCTGLTNLTMATGVPLLGDEDFVACVKLKSIILPASITNIGMSVFQDCTGLTQVTLNDGIPYIGPSMFQDCVSLENMTIATSVTNIGSYAFAGTALTVVALPSGLTGIGAYAFSDSPMGNVTLPGGLLSIGDGVFSDTAATSATIPASVSSIGDDVWTLCGKLTNITVASQNSSYSSLNGVLFDINQVTLIAYPDGLRGTYSLPGSVENIAEGAFAGCGLASVNIDSGVTNIGIYAFYDSTNLTTFDFDGNAPATDPSAFDTNADATIYYLPGVTGWSSPFAGLPAVLAESVAWASPAPITYGTPLTTNQLNAVASVPGSFAYSAPLGSVLNAGAYTLSAVFTPSNTSYLIVVTNTVSLVVSPAQLTITADSTDKNYGNTLTIAPTEFTTSGLVNGDTITGVTLTSAGGAATANVAGSPYAIVPIAVQPSSLTNNYTITYINGELTVRPVPLSIMANNTNKNYGTTITFAGTEFTASGLVNGDMVTSVTLTSAGTPSTATVAGSPYQIVASAAVPSSLTNNYIVTYNNGLLTVSSASLMITANGTNKNYGTAVTFAGTEFSAIGLVNGDTVSSVTLTSAGAPATASVALSPYAIVPSAAQPSSLTNNYAISYVNGQLTISTVPLTITANSTNKTYGTRLNLMGTAFTTSGLVNGDAIASVTLTSTGVPSAASVVGSPYSIVPSAALPVSVATNYSITYSNGVLTVNTAGVAITSGLTANNKIYDGTTTVTLTSNNVVLSGVVGSDVVSLNTNGYIANFASAAVASDVPVTVSGLMLSGVSAGNYNLTQPTGLTASITVPSLQILFSKPDVIISWPTNAAVFVLNQTASLAQPAVWSPVTSGITISGTSNVLTLSASGEPQYFELIAP